MIYTAGSRALACLENEVHRSGEGLQAIFKMRVIGVPDNLAISRMVPDQLPARWHTLNNYALCQPLGETWCQSRSSIVLQVPSSVVPREYHYMLNTRHPGFQAIEILRREDFDFDPRIKGSAGEAA